MLIQNLGHKQVVVRKALRDVDNVMGKAVTDKTMYDGLHQAIEHGDSDTQEDNV
jgi:hypothetical protein